MIMKNSSITLLLLVPCAITGDENSSCSEHGLCALGAFCNYEAFATDGSGKCETCPPSVNECTGLGLGSAGEIDCEVSCTATNQEDDVRMLEETTSGSSSGDSSNSSSGSGNGSSSGSSSSGSSSGSGSGSSSSGSSSNGSTSPTGFPTNMPTDAPTDAPTFTTSPTTYEIDAQVTLVNLNMNTWTSNEDAFTNAFKDTIIAEVCSDCTPEQITLYVRAASRWLRQRRRRLGRLDSTMTTAHLKVTSATHRRLSGSGGVKVSYTIAGLTPDESMVAEAKIEAVADGGQAASNFGAALKTAVEAADATIALPALAVTATTASVRVVDNPSTASPTPASTAAPSISSTVTPSAAPTPVAAPTNEGNEGALSDEGVSAAPAGTSLFMPVALVLPAVLCAVLQQGHGA